MTHGKPGWTRSRLNDNGWAWARAGETSIEGCADVIHLGSRVPFHALSFTCHDRLQYCAVILEPRDLVAARGDGIGRMAVDAEAAVRLMSRGFARQAPENVVMLTPRSPPTARGAEPRGRAAVASYEKDACPACGHFTVARDAAGAFACAACGEHVKHA